MILQIIVEKEDTLPVCQAKAQRISNLLEIDVIFYFDRSGYWFTPTNPPPHVKPTPVPAKK